MTSLQFYLRNWQICSALNMLMYNRLFQLNSFYFFFSALTRFKTTRWELKCHSQSWTKDYLIVGLFPPTFKNKKHCLIIISESLCPYKYVHPLRYHFIIIIMLCVCPISNLSYTYFLFHLGSLFFIIYSDLMSSWWKVSH